MKSAEQRDSGDNTGDDDGGTAEKAGGGLDPERTADAAAMTGPAAVEAYEAYGDPGGSLVDAQYGEMDHMGG